MLPTDAATDARAGDPVPVPVPVPVPTVVLVPVKRLEVAKSRLAPLGDPARRELATAFALDTVELALGTPGVVRVVVVTDDPTVGASARAAGADVSADRHGRSSLNQALLGAGAVARQTTGVSRLLALCADLPALLGSDLTELLTAPAGRGFVADHHGTGTTAVLDDVGWTPRFGPGSAQRHRDHGYAALSASARLRTDVDTPEDLAAAARLGLRPRTAAVVARLTA